MPQKIRCRKIIHTCSYVKSRLRVALARVEWRLSASSGPCLLQGPVEVSCIAREWPCLLQGPLYASPSSGPRVEWRLSAARPRVALLAAGSSLGAVCFSVCGYRFVVRICSEVLKAILLRGGGRTPQVRSLGVGSGTWFRGLGPEAAKSVVSFGA